MSALHLRRKASAGVSRGSSQLNHETLASSVARKRHLKGFLCGLPAYVWVWSLRVDDTTKMVLWLLLAGGLAWWYTVNNGRWLDSSWRLRKVLGLLGLILAGFMGLLVADAIVSGPSTPSGTSITTWSAQRMVYVLLAVPVIEEILFRGLLFESVDSVLLAVLATAAADGIAHGIGRSDYLYALALLPGSLFLGVVRVFAKGVTVPSAVHILINLLAYGSS